MDAFFDTLLFYTGIHEVLNYSYIFVMANFRIDFTNLCLQWKLVFDGINYIGDIMFKSTVTYGQVIFWYSWDMDVGK